MILGQGRFSDTPCWSSSRQTGLRRNYREKKRVSAHILNIFITADSSNSTFHKYQEDPLHLVNDSHNPDDSQNRLLPRLINLNSNQKLILLVGCGK